MKSSFVFNKKLPVLLLASISLAACAVPRDNPNLSAAENQMHRRAAQMRITMGEGAAIGGLAGGLAAGLLTHNAGIGMAGAAAGAALGGGLGYMVANHNQAQAQTEDQYQKAIAQAQDTARQSQSDAQAANEVAEAGRQQLATLNAQYKARQISAKDYNSQINTLRQQANDMKKVAASYRTQAASMNVYAQGRNNDKQMTAAAASTEQSQRQIEQSENTLLSSLGAMPEAPSVSS